jgi:hypothetical protein
MLVCYLIQSHTCSPQIYRLVRILKKSSPSAYVVISHDFANHQLDTSPLLDLPGVKVLEKTASGIRGDFSLVQAYLDTLRWLFNNNINFDWIINLSGQDYPTQPLQKFERLLRKTQYDGFLEWFDVLSPDSHWKMREGRDRYFYRYWRSKKALSNWQIKLLRPLQLLANHTQPFIRVNLYYGLMVGLHNSIHPFRQNFCCYGGSYFKTLSRKCAEYLYKDFCENTQLVNYYRDTRQPDESYMQTVLINSNLFNFCADNLMYVDFSAQTYDGHPRKLTSEDFPKLQDCNYYFARKFDLSLDSTILDELDRLILA